ncbi:MAG: nickel-dependent hydrogenase large subunit [Anaerolineae bacterium]
MPKVYLPLVQSGSTVRIAIDPVTRIEGHLRVEARVAQGAVTDAWSAGTMFRGFERIMVGRDPREAWVIAQRLCGVCTTVHAIASVRAVEDALDITIPDNARLIRNLIEAAQFVHDHVIHFYHLHGLDWADLVSGLSADPAATSALAQSISDWPNNSPAYFTAVRDRLGAFAGTGQLGPFDNAYWGHPAYQLSPEANLLVAAHYLEALDWQRDFVRIHALLGGKNPHPQTYLVGGMSLPVDPDTSAGINGERIAQLREWSATALDFVRRVYIPDLKLVASQYPEWASIGRGVGNYLACGDYPDQTGTKWMPSGIVRQARIDLPAAVFDPAQVSEYVTRSWYAYPEGDASALHPSQGETEPSYTGPQPPYDWLDVNAKYSWLKAPRYNDEPMEVGPLARMAVAWARNHTRVRQEVGSFLTELSLPATALFSTLGRVAARGIETLLMAEQMEPWITQLESNMNSGDLAIHNGSRWDPATWPKDCVGYGDTEAPRGALGHWVHIVNGRIANYQMVVPSTWNGSPRDALGQRGPWEEALLNTPVAIQDQPLEMLRTIHSFDPCMSCAVHVVDTTGQERVRIYAER